MIGSMPRLDSAATADSPTAPAPMTMGISPGWSLRSARRTRRRRSSRRRRWHRWIRFPPRPSPWLRDDQQFPETPLRLRMLPDDPQTTGTTVYQPNRHRRHPRADREGVATARTVADYLADELVAHDDVAVGVYSDRPVRSSIASSGWSMKWTSDAQIAVLKVLRSRSPCPGTGSAVSLTVSFAALQYDCTHQFHILAKFLYYSRYSSPITDMTVGCCRKGVKGARSELSADRTSPRCPRIARQASRSRDAVLRRCARARLVPVNRALHPQDAVGPWLAAA